MSACATESDLLAHFDRIAEAPDAVARLRRFILELAVRGRLVEHNSGDEPATQLLCRIEAARAQRTQRRNGNGSIPDSSDIPFTAPHGWTWASIRQTTCDHGQTVPAADFTYIDVGSIDKEAGRIADARVVTPDQAPSRARKIVHKGDVLYSCVRPYLLNVAVVDTDMHPPPIASTAFAVLDGFGLILPKYLWIALRSPTMVDCVAAKMRGQAYPAINDGDFGQLLLPIPPQCEQKRITDRVDELISLCDRLEAEQKEQQHRRNRLIAASLHCLADTSDPESFCTHARFHLQHLPRLTTRPEHVQQLQQAVLELAVRGTLVPQHASDECVDRLLERADLARRDTATRDRRAEAEQLDLLGAEDRWDIPLTWRWRALADLALFIDYRGQTPAKSPNGIRLITAKNVRQGYVSLSPEEFVTEATYSEWMTRGLPKPGDVLFTTEAPMGYAAVVELNEPFALAQRVIDFRLYGALDPAFMVLYLGSAPFQRILDKAATGLTAKGIKAAKLKRLPVAVPPLAEQRRIAARVSDLLSLCDQLESQLTTIQTESRHLLEALLHEALLKGPTAKEGISGT